MHRLLIIEGIAGAGKDTLQDQLIKKLEKKYTIFSFREQELLWSWRHAWVPHIATMRMDLMHNLLDFIEKELKKKKDVVFILNRFHISFMLFNYSKEHKKRYDAVLEKLRSLPTKVYVPTIEVDEIKDRSTHDERPKIWKEHLKKRLKWAGFSSITDMYTAEQKKILTLVASQGIPFEAVRTELED